MKLRYRKIIVPQEKRATLEVLQGSQGGRESLMIKDFHCFVLVLYLGPASGELDSQRLINF